MGELANRSEATRAKYQAYFHKFCDWVGTTPDQVIADRTRDLKQDDQREQRKVESQLKGFIAQLARDGMSTATQQVAYAAVRSFFEMHYQPLRMRKGDYPQGESLGARAATTEDIRALCDDAPTRIRALILLLKDTGLRVSDVVRLTYGDVAAGLNAGTTLIPLTLVTKKNRVVAKTFVGPEAIDALQAYLAERRKGTRAVPPETVHPHHPLFRTRSPTVKALSRSGLSSTICFYAQKRGINADFSAHSFRKFFQTQLEASGMNSNWIDQMIGHRLINARDAYSQPTCEQLQAAYEKAYRHLRVFEDASDAARARVEQLEDEVRRLRTELTTTHGARASEIDELKQRLQKMEHDHKIFFDEKYVKEFSRLLKAQLAKRLGDTP